ncbi:tRNA lysidine(34) synthetase TilS [Sedimentitalea sp. HM32M-2]|uniref:tRNA lysidine(34) synthetase TilS n=1 Tax=Sedimentitalea sp. HM32M-2 TaxID=3351566 RepID=UPI00363321B2
MTGPDGDILAQVRAVFGPRPPQRLGVAVSGGGDSMALLHLLSRCFEPETVSLFCASIDHGLRPEAATEARLVADLAHRLNIPHATLRWSGWDGSGNLQDQARKARHRLLADWAGSQQIGTVALGHTMDDQAETLLLRLARSAGVDGLQAMPVRRSMQGLTLVRPLLGLRRTRLRSYLRDQGIQWAEDPSNDDARFDRIRMRAALQSLAPLGLTAEALSGVAQNMQRAADALDHCTARAGRELARIDGGDLVIEAQGFHALPGEIARRLLVHAITWIGGAAYPPRRGALLAALAAARSGRSATLGGCLVLSDRQAVRVCREFAAVRSLRVPADEAWDRRWRLQGKPAAGMDLAALGEKGLAQCPDWRATGRPRAALLASPALWLGTELVAAPMAGRAQGWHIRLLPGSDPFILSLLSH